MFEQGWGDHFLKRLLEIWSRKDEKRPSLEFTQAWVRYHDKYGN